MRSSLATLAAALIAASACSPFEATGDVDEAASAGPDADAGELAVVAVTVAPSGDCLLRWDGRPIEPEAARRRAQQVMMAEIERIGGPERLTTFPRAVVEAPRDAPYRCVRPALDALARAGFAEAALRLAGRGPGQDSIHGFPVPGDYRPIRPAAVLGIRDNGEVLVDGGPVQPGPLRDLLGSRIAGASDADDAPVLIVPQDGTRFELIHELVGTARAGRNSVLLRPTRDEPEGVAPDEPSPPPAPRI